MLFSASRYFFAPKHSMSYPDHHLVFPQGRWYFGWQIWGRWVINPGWRSDAARLQIHIRIYYWQISVLPADWESSLSPHSEKISTIVALNTHLIRICEKVRECAACSIFQSSIGSTTRHFWSAAIHPTDTHSEAIQPCFICWSYQLQNKLPALSPHYVSQLPHLVCYFSIFRINTSALSDKPVLGC